MNNKSEWPLGPHSYNDRRFRKGDLLESNNVKSNLYIVLKAYDAKFYGKVKYHYMDLYDIKNSIYENKIFNDGEGFILVSRMDK